jgi:hypothetical protein
MVGREKKTKQNKLSETTKFSLGRKNWKTVC